jgi:hypothetical protein
MAARNHSLLIPNKNEVDIEQKIHGNCYIAEPLFIECNNGFSE